MLRFLNHRRSIVIIGLLLSIFAVAPMPANAESSNKGTSDSLVGEIEVTIHSKGSDYIVSPEGRFVLDDISVLTNMSNETISIEKLPVPCVAEIKYQLQTGEDPLLLNLKIKKNLPDARTDWSGEGEGSIPR
ncbi:MAG: hypothetical protein ABIF87_04535 [Pseudomonadota bacterium]